MNKPTRVAIALGSNLGDRDAHLDFALARLSTSIDHLQPSARYETVPVGVPDDQPDFLNAAAIGVTTLDAAAMLQTLLGIEAERGRARPHPGAARTLDLDLILFDEQVIDRPGVVVPHPRFRERRFVLEPLAEIAPGWRDPVSGLTVGQLLAKLPPVPATRRR